MSALVALFHVLNVAAKSSRAAVADRREGLSLFGVENMSPLCEAGRLLRVRLPAGSLRPFFFLRGQRTATDLA